MSNSAMNFNRLRMSILVFLIYGIKLMKYVYVTSYVFLNLICTFDWICQKTRIQRFLHSCSFIEIFVNSVEGWINKNI